MVCALGGARRRRGFEPRFVRPSTGPLARSPPPPPLASPSTTGTTDGWVACLVLVVFHFCCCPVQTSEHTEEQGTEHNTSAAVPPVTGTAGRWEPHLLLVFPFGDSNRRLQGSSRLHSRCSARPKASVMSRWPSAGRCLRMVMSSAKASRSRRTRRHPNPVSPPPST